MIRVEIGNGHPGPRLYVKGRRIHHGLTGAVTAVIGAVLCLHDRRDWPWPTVDR